MDKFIYPVFVQRGTFIQFSDANNAMTLFYVPPGVYHILSFFDEVEYAINSVVVGNNIEIALGADNKVVATSTMSVPFVLGGPGANPRSLGNAMLGQCPHTGGSLYAADSGASSKFSPLGVWAPPVEASDNRISTSREAFQVAGQYYNAWAPKNTRNFLYKNVHPVHVMYSPYRAPEGAPPEWGGLRTGDTNNTFQSLFESVADGDDIFYVAGGAPQEVLRLSPSPALREHLTAFGVPEHYTVDFKAVQNGQV